MPAIRLNPEDNFSIITTAVSKAPWGAYRAQVQIKTYNEDLEFTTDNVAHLGLFSEALEQLMEDIRDESLKFEQIRSRVFNSIKDINPKKKFDRRCV